jgi:hypothetical protein
MTASTTRSLSMFPPPGARQVCRPDAGEPDESQAAVLSKERGPLLVERFDGDPPGDRSSSTGRRAHVEGAADRGDAVDDALEPGPERGG